MCSNGFEVQTFVAQEMRVGCLDNFGAIFSHVHRMGEGVVATSRGVAHP